MRVEFRGISSNETKINKYDYLDLLSEYDFCSFINVNTRLLVSQNHSCLDHVFIRDNFNSPSNINAGVLLTDTTDYCSTVISIPVLMKTKSVNNIINVINYVNLKLILCNEKWTSVYGALTPQTTVSLSFWK